MWVSWFFRRLRPRNLTPKKLSRAVLNLPAQVPPRTAEWTNNPRKTNIFSACSHSGGTSVSSADFFLEYFWKKTLEHRVSIVIGIRETNKTFISNHIRNIIPGTVMVGVYTGQLTIRRRYSKTCGIRTYQEKRNEQTCCTHRVCTTRGASPRRADARFGSAHARIYRGYRIGKSRP